MPPTVLEAKTTFELQTVYGWSTTHLGGAASTEHLIERLQCASATRVLDLGSGAGQTACALAHRFGCRVVGLDLSAIHVATASDRAARYSLARRVAFIQGEAAHLPFPNAAFDRVLVESVLSFVPDAAAVLAEIQRVLRPGGLVAFNEAAIGPGLPPPVPTRRMRAAGYQYFQPRSPETWRALVLAVGLEMHEIHANAGVPIRDALTLVGWARFLVSRWLRFYVRHAREPRRWPDGLLFFDLVRSFALRRAPYILAVAAAPPVERPSQQPSGSRAARRGPRKQAGPATPVAGSAPPR